MAMVVKRLELVRVSSADEIRALTPSTASLARYTIGCHVVGPCAVLRMADIAGEDVPSAQEPCSYLKWNQLRRPATQLPAMRPSSSDLGGEAGGLSSLHRAWVGDFHARVIDCESPQ